MPMHDLTWAASTPEGIRLGALAAQQVHAVVDPSPWWTAPLEPLRWFNALIGTTPHLFYSLGELAVVALVCGVFWERRSRSPAAALAVFLTVLMTLTGQFFAIHALDTVLPGGVRWVVPAGAPYRLANLHSHSQASGGDLMPEQLVEWHYRHGYRVMAVSDSNGLRGVPLAQDYVARSGLPMVLVPAEEYRGPRTHLLMFNIDEPVVPSDKGLAKDIALARKQGGLVIAAHPWTSDRSAEALIACGVQGFEVTNGSVLAAARTRHAAELAHLPEIGDLDFRSGNFPLTATVLPAWADSPARVQQALREGACAAIYFSDEMAEGGFRFWRQLTFLERRARDRMFLMIGGTAFWMLVGLAWVRGRRGRVAGGNAFAAVLRPVVRGEGSASCDPHFDLVGAAALAAIVVVCVGLAALTCWCMWWQFRTGWLPRTEWALYAWVLTCPLCWWATVLVTRLAGAGKRPNADGAEASA